MTIQNVLKNSNLLKSSNLINTQIYYMCEALQASHQDKKFMLENIKTHIECQIEQLNNLISQYETFDDFQNAIDNAGVYSTVEELESIIKRAPLTSNDDEDRFLVFTKEFLNNLKQKESV